MLCSLYSAFGVFLFSSYFALEALVFDSRLLAIARFLVHLLETLLYLY